MTLSADASPATVFPGGPVTVTASTGNLDSSLNAVYTWSGNGVTGNGTTAAVATASLAPGTYTVKVRVREGKNGKEGLKPWEIAETSASFRVCQVYRWPYKTPAATEILVSATRPDSQSISQRIRFDPFHAADICVVRE